MKFKRISAEITEQQYNRLKWLCELEGTTISEIIQTHIYGMLDNKQKEDPEIWDMMDRLTAFHNEMRKKYGLDK